MGLRARLVIAAAALLALVFVLSKVTRRPSEPRSEPSAPTSVPESAAPAAAELVQPVEPALESREVRAAEPQQELEPQSPSPDPTLAEIRGRFVFEDDSPAAGVELSVHGWESNQELVMRFGKPENWTDPTGVTGEDGAFALRFDPPRAYQFTLEAHLEGFAGVEWRWGEIGLGEVVDVGVIRLQEGATIEGRVVDADGNPLIGQFWMIYADSIDAGAGPGRDETRVIVPIDPSTGAFRAEGVMPGKVELKAHSEMANWVDGPKLRVAPGETLTADIVYAGPDNSARITVSTFCRQFHVMSRPAAEHVKLRLPDGELRVSQRVERSSQSYSFDDLAPGQYVVEIDDPRYLPWQSSFVTPGTDVDARLEGNAALALAVSDASGAPLSDFIVRVEFRNVNFSPREFEVKHKAGLVRGMFAGDYRVEVRAGDAIGIALVEGLAIGETRTVPIQLGVGPELSGRVVFRDGQPAARIEVLLLSPAEKNDSADSPILEKNSMTGDASSHRKELERVVSDAAGSFRFALTGPGAYVLHASVEGGDASTPVLDVPPAGLSGIKLELPRGGHLMGKLRAQGFESWTGMRVALEPVLSQDPDAQASPFRGIERLMSFQESIRAVSPDGTFELGPVATGPAKVFLLMPEVVQRRGSATFGDSNSDRIELGEVVIEEGRVVTREFLVAEPPGTVSLLVLVNGVAGAGLWVTVGRASGETDAHGRFGPRRVFAGTWSVDVSSPEERWKFAAGELEARSLLDVEQTVHVTVATGQLLFLDRETGNPLAERVIGLLEDGFPMVQRETDSEGRATFTLVPGSHEFLLDADAFFESFGEREEGTAPRTATVEWGAEGPLVTRIEL